MVPAVITRINGTQVSAARPGPCSRLLLIYGKCHRRELVSHVKNKAWDEGGRERGFLVQSGLQGGAQSAQVMSGMQCDLCAMRFVLHKSPLSS